MKYPALRKLFKPATMLTILGLLMLAQVSALSHSVEHLFHDTQELCQGFIGVEKSPSIASLPEPVLVSPIPAVEIFCCLDSQLLPFPGSYSIRAPPVPAVA